MGVHLEVSLGLWQDRPADEVIRTAAIADSLGYTRIWIGEMATWDAFALGAHIGRDLQQAGLVLGPLAVAVRDPAMIAIGAASVAALTGREVSVALGTSSSLVVESWHGRDRSRSGLALAESAAAVRSLLDGNKTELDGKILRTSGYRLRLEAPKSKLIVAAFGDRAIRAAAAHADTMVLNLVDPPSVRELVGKMEAAAADCDRPRPRVAVWATCAIDPGPQTIEQLRRGVVGYLAAPGYAEMFCRAGYADLVAFARTRPHPRDLLAAVPAALNAVVGLVGDRGQVASRMREYIEAGVDDIVLVPSATEEDPAGEHSLRAAAEIGRQINEKDSARGR